MEMLGVLEKKIEGLIRLVQNLRMERARFETENVALREKVSSLEGSLLKESETLRQENESARKTVDDLIADIDSFVETGSQ